MARRSTGHRPLPSRNGSTRTSCSSTSACPTIDGFAVADRLAGLVSARVVLVSSRDRAAYGDRIASSSAIGFIGKGDLDGTALRRWSRPRHRGRASMQRRTIVLVAIGAVALVFGPVATYQLTLTAPRSPALLLADVAVGWSMIAAGLISRIGDRQTDSGPWPSRPGLPGLPATSRPLVTFGSPTRPPSSTAGSTHCSPSSSWPIRPDESAVGSPAGWPLGFIVVQAAWSIAKAYGLRPIAWWDCPTCIGTVDDFIATAGVLDTLGRIETAVLTSLSIGVLVLVVTRWLQASGTARARQAPVVLAGVVLALGFTGGFLLQTIAPERPAPPAASCECSFWRSCGSSSRSRC